MIKIKKQKQTVVISIKRITGVSVLPGLHSGIAFEPDHVKIVHWYYLLLFNKWKIRITQKFEKHIYQ